MTLNKEIGTRKSNIFNLLYLFFFLFIPFVYSKELIDPALIPRQIYLTFFVLIVCTVICFKVYVKIITADFTYLKFALPLLLIALLISNIISFSQSTAISESVYSLSKYLILILFFIITTYLLIQKELSIINLIKTIIIFSAIAVIISIYQLILFYFTGKHLLNDIQIVSGNFANKNLLSSILFLTFPFLINSITLSKPWKVLSAIIIFLIPILVWTMQTKSAVGALIIFIISLFIIYLMYWKGSINSRYVKTIIISVSLVIIAGTITTIKYIHKFPHFEIKETALTRLSLWKNSCKMIEENFFLGVGSGNWQVHFPKYGLNSFDTKEIKDGLTTFQRPHNDFLWIFCEQGFFGFLAYVFIFITAIIYSFKLLKISEKWEDKWLYASILATILGYIFIASVDFPLERIEHQIMLFLLLAIIVYKYYSKPTSNRLSKIVLKLPLLICFMFLIVLNSFIISKNRYSGEYYTRKLYEAHHNADWYQLKREADKAINFCYVMDPMSAPIEWYKGVALFSLGNINDAKSSFEKAYSINPNNIHVLNNLASCYEKLGDHKKAEEIYIKAILISPDFDEALLNLSAVYYNTKNYEKAFETIDKCNVNSTDLKYQTFLPAILDSWVDVVFSKQKDEGMIKKLLHFKNTKSKLLSLYFESKNRNINFKEYLLVSVNNP